MTFYQTDPGIKAQVLWLVPTGTIPDLTQKCIYCMNKCVWISTYPYLYCIILKWSECHHKGRRFDSRRCEKLSVQELDLGMTLQQSSFITPSGFPVLKKFKNTLVTFLIYIWYNYIWNTFYWACPLLPCTYITGHVSARISTCDGGPLVVQFIMFYQDRENWEISDVRSPGQLTQPEL